MGPLRLPLQKGLQLPHGLGTALPVQVLRGDGVCDLHFRLFKVMIGLRGTRVPLVVHFTRDCSYSVVKVPHYRYC